MQASLYRLKHLGITETHPTNISSAMSRLPDEAIALAAASHIERELQITPWNLSCNFVACTSQVIYAKSDFEFIWHWHLSWLCAENLFIYVHLIILRVELKMGLKVKGK